MILKRSAALCLVMAVIGSPAFAAATVDQLVKSKFSGSAKIVNVFGGKAAREGLEIRTAVGGNRQATKTGKNVEVIDLDEQMIWRYAVNRKGKAKKCRPTTFDEFREQLAAMQDLPFFGNAEASTTSPDDGSAPEGAEQPLQYEVTVNFEETGQQETHAGMTGDVFRFEAIAHRPGLPVEEGGGVLETTFVVGEKTAAWDEMQAWNRKWAEVIGDMTGMGDNLVKLLAGSPALQKVMTELHSKQAELDGTMLRMSMRLSTVPDPRVQERAKADQDAGGDDIPTSLGGLGAKLGGALLKKNKDAASTKGPQELYMNEVVVTSVSGDSDALLTLPASCNK